MPLTGEPGSRFRSPVVWANLIPNEPELFLRVAYYQSTIEGCARPGNESLEVDGDAIRVSVTLMQPPPTAWAIPCDEELVELDTVLPIAASLEAGRTYRVIVNDIVVTTFTLPGPELRYTFIAESPIESVEVDVLESAPPQYQLRIVSGLPKGRSCSQFNGYEVTRRDANRLEVAITHHEVADRLVACTADYPSVETVVPLGSGFEPGEEYEVRVNGEARARSSPSDSPAGVAARGVGAPRWGAAACGHRGHDRLHRRRRGRAPALAHGRDAGGHGHRNADCGPDALGYANHHAVTHCHGRGGALADRDGNTHPDRCTNSRSHPDRDRDPDSHAVGNADTSRDSGTRAQARSHASGRTAGPLHGDQCRDWSCLRAHRDWRGGLLGRQ